MNRTRRRIGFTLIELIVVLSLMGVATTLGVVMFARVTDVWKQASIRTELDATVNNVFEQMRQDFDAVVSGKLAGVSVRGATQTAQDKRFFKIPLEDDQVIVPIEIAPGPGARVQRADVRYVIERKEDMPTLVRTTTLSGSPNAPVTHLKLAQGVIAMRVEFIGKGPESSWQKDWLQAAAPGAVRVSLTVADPNRYYEQISRKAVFPIKVD